MLAFLSAWWGTILVGALTLALLGGLTVFLIRSSTRKKGQCTGCCADCAFSCPSADRQEKKPDRSEN